MQTDIDNLMAILHTYEFLLNEDILPPAVAEALQLWFNTHNSGPDMPAYFRHYLEEGEESTRRALFIHNFSK